MKIELVESLKGHTGKVWNAKWNPQGTLLASCGEDKTIRLWGKSGQQWKAKAVLQDGHQKTIREVSWSPSGKCLASASFDGTTAIWDNDSGQFECNATIEGHENEVKSVSYSPSGQFLATCSRDKSVWVWELENGEYECSSVLNAHTQDVKKVIWHPHEDLIASASYDNSIKMFKEDPADNEWMTVATLNSHNSTVWSISFDQTGTRLVSCSDDQTVKIWKQYKPGNPEGVPTVDNEATWKCVCTISGYHDGSVFDVAWCKLTGHIATACADNCIRIFQEVEPSNDNQPNFELMAVKHHAHEQDVNSVFWHPTEPGLLCSTSDDSLVKIWEIEND
ncbi:probable cytosolic iron-sulfur protein assembly protein Ciao1 [Cimex lectularius]|uniref:Probable cytosolic iron-sulfur protein assembly protein Ciao1 n=1 Tax=Cimex lectularius TaxID=79782 RepID=A0A8I6SAS4_CIMLE|nr:probable cytosolic iron-sulfur protein assembly protein Ciao1 [Cimex lectularius]